MLAGPRVEGTGPPHPISSALPHSPPLSPCSSALMESLINPLQDRIEDWKKTANQLDKDHAKGTAGPSWICPGGAAPVSWGGSPLTALLCPQSTSEPATRSRKNPPTPSSSRKRLEKVRGGSPGGGYPHQSLHGTPGQGGHPRCDTLAANQGGGGHQGGPTVRPPPPPPERGVPAWPGGVAGRQGRASRPLASFHTFSLSPSLFPPLHILPVELLGK